MKPLFRPLCLCALWFAFGAVLAEPAGGRGGQGRSDSAPAPAEQGRRNDESRPSSPQDAARRPSKLSPEERKELRQQIHEAGHDLYQPKRQAPP